MDDRDLELEDEKPAQRSTLRPLVIGMVAFCVAGVAFVLMQRDRQIAPFQRVAAPAATAMAATAPPVPRTRQAPNLLTYRADRSGHYFVDAEVNGARIRFLVDTGASFVSLTPEDARAAGLGGNLSYSVTLNTAHGVARAARTSLREVRLEQLSVSDVPAVVMEESMGVSLMGMSFLGKLGGYTIRDGVLTIEW
jgi:aspartyl protease family protein